MGRSLARIDRSDLLRLAALAAEAEEGLFARHPDGVGRYAGRLLCRALCQGAALHYLDGRNGVKDFDVWSFYAARDDGPFPYRRRGTADFGPSKSGRWPGDPPSYAGRRVDFLGSRCTGRRPGRRRGGAGAGPGSRSLPRPRRAGWRACHRRSGRSTRTGCRRAVGPRRHRTGPAAGSR